MFIFKHFIRALIDKKSIFVQAKMLNFYWQNLPFFRIDSLIEPGNYLVSQAWTQNANIVCCRGGLKRLEAPFILLCPVTTCTELKLSICQMAHSIVLPR